MNNKFSIQHLFLLSLQLRRALEGQDKTKETIDNSNMSKDRSNVDRSYSVDKDERGILFQNDSY